jgi:hypothetical protein
VFSSKSRGHYSVLILFLWALSPLDDLATFGPLPWFPATTARCGGVFIAVDLAAYAKSIFATILRDVFSGINSWTAHNTASINQQNVVA